jgi:AcrR family transcriptional regulator
MTANDAHPDRSTPRGRGRPRDPAKDAAVQAAVRESLVEDGFQATTIPNVARRAGIGAPTIYRRWPTQADLLESIFDDMTSYGEAVVGYEGFEQVVRQMVEGSFNFYGEPASRVALPGLLIEYNLDHERYERLAQRLEAPALEEFRAAHAAAVEAGDVTASSDPDTLFGMIIGSAIYYATIKREGGAAVPGVVAAIMAAARAS